MSQFSDFVPSARLRFVERPLSADSEKCARILQQWWAPDVPAYMRDARQGEWRDVALESI